MKDKDLNESETKFRAIFEQAQDGFLLIDEDGRILEFNDVAHNNLGYTREEFERLTITDIDPDEDVNGLRERMQQIMSQGDIVFEVRHLTKNGEIRNVQVSGRVIELAGRRIFSSVWTDITERKKAEEQLLVSERKFKNLTEITTDWIWEVDKNGVYTYVSPKVKELLGYEVSEVLGKTPFDLMPEDEAERVSRIFREKVTYKKPFYGLENINYHKDGHLIILETSGIPIFNEKGQLKGYRGIDRDITERKRAEDKLKRYQFMVESAHDAIFFKDLKSRYIIANNKTAEAFGLPKEKVIGKNDYAIMPNKKEARKNIENDQIVFKTGKPKEIVKHMTGADGNEYWFQAIKTPQFDDKGEGSVVGLVGIARDITERRKREEEIRILKEYNENIVTSIPTTIISCGEDLRIRSVNKTCCEMFNRKKKEIVGKGLGAILSAKVVKIEKLDKRILEVLKTKEPSGEMEIRHNFPRIGNRVLNLKMVNIAREEEVLLLINDITEKRQLERRLIFSERMASVGQLAAGVSHEFNNLLAVIRSSAEFAQKTKRDDDIKNCIEKTLQCVDRGTEIAKDLLSFSRRIGQKREKTNLPALIEKVLALLKTDLQKSKVGVIRKFQKLPELSVDKGQMQQVLLNLIINAKQAMMKKGGKLTICAKRENRAISIRFNNTGELIKKEDINRVFDPFFTTKGSLGGGNVGGIGLGLSVSYGIIQSHGGTITVESSPGKGTTFAIRLPMKI